MIDDMTYCTNATCKHRQECMRSADNIEDMTHTVWLARFRPAPGTDKCRMFIQREINNTKAKEKPNEETRNNQED